MSGPCHEPNCRTTTTKNGAYCCEHAIIHGFSGSTDSFIRGKCRAKWCRFDTILGAYYCDNHRLEQIVKPRAETLRERNNAVQAPQTIPGTPVPVQPLDTVHKTALHEFVLNEIEKRKQEIDVLEQALKILGGGSS